MPLKEDLFHHLLHEGGGSLEESREKTPENLVNKRYYTGKTSNLDFKNFEATFQIPHGQCQC